jgi:hypothetical protein
LPSMSPLSMHRLKVELLNQLIRWHSAWVKARTKIRQSGPEPCLKLLFPGITGLMRLRPSDRMEASEALKLVEKAIAMDNQELEMPELEMPDEELSDEILEFP